MKYMCPVCGYSYDPELGDMSIDISPGTAWEDIPDDFACPVCGLGKEAFYSI
ncbi:MAG: rubredoxin [Coriobacteriales bacterium]|jgi:rubredoxin|nr:rubredoxin [Coriobacteriales bacterium]